ncbi:MAG TPA: redoxin domain-containing protein [Bryobacteraceae bacterium]|nr:redoxin domain-containing protein [Bryobacteraceae bacterium]
MHLTRPVLAIAVLSLLVSCSKSPDTTHAASVKPDKDRKVAPDFTLKDASGASVKLSDYKGKVVILDFWATWCGPCKIEIPWFMEFEQEYKDRGFAVVGVSMDEDGWSAVKPYIEARKINYRILLGNDHVGDLYGGVESLPTTFLIDRTGKIAAVHVGLEMGKDGFKNEIDRLLQGNRASLRPVLATDFFTRPE